MLDLSNVTNITLNGTEVTQIEDSLGTVLWTSVKPDYFYVEDCSGSDNTLTVMKGGSGAPTLTVYTSTDLNTWRSNGTTSTSPYVTFTIPANSRLYVKCTADTWASSTSAYNKMYTSGNFAVGGNIMSLLYGDDFENETTLEYNCSFSGLFTGATTLVDASELELPATTLTENCYQNMFKGCTGLTTAPALPATTLTYKCYSGTFSGCTSLTQAPATLPATTVAEECYSWMFENCTALTQAPATLPATTLVQNCYRNMFKGCTALTTAPTLPATTLAYRCYGGIFSGCTSLTTAPELPATTLAQECYGWMFENCTALAQAPELPATTLITDCYKYMFSGCTNLNSVTTYATDISASNCLNNWLSNVAATGDFYNLGGATYTADSGSGIPSGWTEHRANCNVSISAGSNGSVSVNGVTGNYSQSVLNGTQLTLVATPDSGYVFDEWSDGDTNATRTITVTNDLTLTAAFVTAGVPDYHIQYTTTDNNQLSISNSVITNHTFTNGVGDITINTTELPSRFFENKTTLRTVSYGGNIEFNNGGWQHSGCTNLESVDLPANMTYVPNRLFRTCSKLARVDLPASVTIWHREWPFYYTATQTTGGYIQVYVHNSTSLPTIDTTSYSGVVNDNGFYITGNNGNPAYSATNIENLIRLYVPSSLYNDYITTAPHSSVASCISSY